MRQVSKKRAKLNVAYRKAKAVWRAGHDGRCEMRQYYMSGPTSRAVLSRVKDALNDGYYYAGTKDGTNSRCDQRADENPHHMALRGPNLCKIETFCGLCPAHHRWVHEHPNEARRLGYLI